MHHTAHFAKDTSYLDGLWVVFVGACSSDTDERVPVMARAGNEHNYLLGFKNVVSARNFCAKNALANAEPCMVVKANKDRLLKAALDNAAAGVLVEYDPSTQEYQQAHSLV